MSDEKPTRRIILDIEESTYREIRTTIGIRKMSQNCNGIVDALVAKIVQKIDAGEDYFYVEKRRDAD
jgi:hypothetical protein